LEKPEKWYKKRHEPMTDNSRIQIYQSPDGETRVDVRFEHESVWLTQAQMGQVFDTTPENVLMHLKDRGTGTGCNC
jgi:hypothetical protein